MSKSLTPKIVLFDNSPMEETIDLVNSALYGTGLSFKAIDNKDLVETDEENFATVYELKGKK